MTKYRDIPGFPGYRVGSDGSVWSRRRLGRRHSTSPSLPLESSEWHRLKTPILKSGYPSVALRQEGKVVTLLLHRLVLEVFVGPCPDGKEACHFPDRNRTNCRLSNLRWDTRAANSHDAAVHGTRQRGERNGHALLTEDAVRSARLRYAQGATARELANEFQVSRQAMACALSRRTWKHVA